MRTRIWHSDWKPRWLIRCVSAALLSFMDKQVHESPLTDALFLLVSKSDEVTTT